MIDFKTRWLFLGLATTGLLSAATGPQRPNVLFIAVDDLRPQLHCYGDTVAITPNLDRLAARGTLFARAYCQQAVCNASRQSLLSGRRPDSIRVWDLKTLFRETAPDVVSLPEHFKLNGYFAQSFGKIYHGQAGMADPQSWSVPEQFQYESKRDDYHLAENREPRQGGKAAPFEFVGGDDDEYRDGMAVKAAVIALEKFAANPGQPFFLAVGIRKPHLPFTGPKKYWDLYDEKKIPPVDPLAAPEGAPAMALHNSVELRGYKGMPKGGPVPPEEARQLRHGYYAAASFADAQIGRVLDALERTGLAKNTIVVVWGDHGYHLGEQGMWTKITNYEADTRVPFIIATPDARPRGVRTEARVELLDIYPTLIELCGLPSREKLEGRSLVPNLGTKAINGREYAISEFPRPWGTGYLDRKSKYMGYAIRSETQRYIEWRSIETGAVAARELYAYRGDELFEIRNLADDPAQQATIAKLSGLLPRPKKLELVKPAKGKARAAAPDEDTQG